MIHTRQTAECDRCHKMTDLAQLVHERLKKEKPEQAGPIEDFEKLQSEEAEKFAAGVDVEVLGVKIVFKHMCEACRQRSKNLALEIAGRYGEVQPANPRKSKKAVGEKPPDQEKKDGELPLNSSSMSAS